MKVRVGLYTRLFVSHFGLAVVVMGGVGFYVFENMQRTYLQTLETSLEDQAQVVARRLGPVLAQSRFDEVQSRLLDLGLRGDTHVLVTNVAQEVVGSTEPEEARLRGRPSEAAGLREALRGQVQRVSDPPGDELLYVATAVTYRDAVVGAVRVSYGVAALEDQIRGLFKTLGIGALVALAASGLAGLGLAHGLGRSARRLAETARQLAGGHLSARTRLTGNHELAEAGRAFDQMADQLQAAQLERQALLNTLSHEVHTAVTGMGTALEVLGREEGLDKESRRLLLGGLQIQVRRLRRLASDLVEVARLARGQLPLYEGTVFPEDLVREVTGGFAADAAERGVRLDCMVGEGLPPLRADGDRLAQALGNLVENALAYTSPGHRVLVTAEMSNGFYVLAVRREGPETASDVAEATFETLAWAGAPLSGRNSLRLAITKGVIEAHGGRLEQARLAQGGTVLRICLPAQVQASQSALVSPPPAS